MEPSLRHPSHPFVRFVSPVGTKQHIPFLLSVVVHGVQPRKHPRGTAAHLNPILDHGETSPGTSQKTTTIKSWYKPLPDIILVGVLHYCLIDDCMSGVICIKMYLLLVHRLPRRCTVHICICRHSDSASVPVKVLNMLTKLS